MTILAVETSAAVASAALLRDGALLLSLDAEPSQKHAETLMPLIQKLLSDARVPLDSVGAFAVDIGPGSFTGVRIGVCAVNAMAFALERPVIGVDSLRTLAEPYWDAGARICALVDAGHGSSYAALYENGLCLMPPSARETETLIASLPENTRVVRDTLPAAANVALAAWRQRAEGLSAAVPLYVQPSQAERLFDQRREERAHD